MNTNQLFLTCLLMISVVFTQGAFDSYDIPEYEYRTFQLSGSDLFNSYSQGDYSETRMNVGADYMSKYQSPGYNLSYGLNFANNSLSMSQGSNDFDESSWNMDIPFSVDKYFNDTKGMFGFVNGELKMAGGDTYPNWANEDDSSDLDLFVGGGYGRIVSAKPVAQAYAIADALGIDADDDTISAIAAVIGSQASYESIYKDDATQQYYNDLAEASGVNGSAMQIQKVLTSPAYNISDRFTGWDVRAGITNNYIQCDDCDLQGTMTIEANYAMPVEMDSQVLVNFIYTMDRNDTDEPAAMSDAIDALIEVPNSGGGNSGGGGDDDDYYDDDYYDDDYYDDYYYYDDYCCDYGRSSGGAFGGWTTMNLNASYTKDHSYNWSSSATLNYVSQSYDTMDYDSNYNPIRVTEVNSGMVLTLSTTYSILNQLSVTASYTYGSADGDADRYDSYDPISEIKTSVTYWIF